MIPVLFAVDDDEAALREVERELVDRYSRSYRVVCASSAAEAVAELGKLKEAGEDVALVLAAQSLGGMSGSELLGRVRELHAHAQRGLLIDWGSWGEVGTAEEIFEAMARRQIEYYVVRPSQTPDELFHQSVSTLPARVGQRAAALAAHGPHRQRLVDRGRAQELKEVLGRCAVPARLRARRFPGRPGPGRRER